MGSKKIFGGALEIPGQGRLAAPSFKAAPGGPKDLLEQTFENLLEPYPQIGEP